MTVQTDEQLMVSLVKEGNLNSLEELLTRHEKSLFNYLVRHTGDFHTAQDLFQETFYRIFKHRESFNPDLNFSTWAYRIATNLCIDEFKKKARELEVSLEDNRLNQEPSFRSGDRGINKISSNPSPEGKLIKEDLEEKIKDLVKSLPEKLKSVFILSEYQELSCREIAKILEIPVGTVKSRIHHSFKRLMELMQKRGLVDEVR
jgi:RNA polymerase sigma-70 factor (ECF subfamily)